MRPQMDWWHSAFERPRPRRRDFVELGGTCEAAALEFTASGCDNAGWFELNVRRAQKANLRHWKLRIW